jgi:hypothetical protein
MKLTAIFKQKLNESDWKKEHERLHLQELKDWIQTMRIRNTRVVKEGNEWVIHADGNVSIAASALPIKDGVRYFPYQFGEINGDFRIAPTDSSRTKLSLKNGPITVYGTYAAANLGLTSLDGMAGVVHDSCDISGNELTSWDGIPSQCGKLIVAGNKITSFTGISKQWIMGSELVCDPIKRGVLELLEIEGLESVAFMHNFHGTSEGTSVNKAQQIINTNLQGNREAIEMQSDFLDTDLEEWTKK